MIGIAIRTILTADGTIARLFANRIYPDKVPQRAGFPYLTYQVIGTEPTNDKDGASKLDIVRVQLDIYTTNYDTAQTAAESVREVLDRYRGTVGAAVIDKVIFAGQSSGEPDADMNIFWISQDYEIRIKR